MEKNPADRYGTAQELADDLRRFLTDEPIWARRANLAKRVRKWARRHRTLVSSVLVGLVVAIAGLAEGVGWVARDAAARHQAIALAVTDDL